MLPLHCSVVIVIHSLICIQSIQNTETLTRYLIFADWGLLEFQEELALSLKNLHDKEVSLKRIHMNSAYMFKYIKVTVMRWQEFWFWKKNIYICSNKPTICNYLTQSQALETQSLIKGHFEQLHQDLYQEESARIAAVKKEEDEKIAGLKDKMKELSAEVLSLTETISVIQEQLEEDDLILLKVRTGMHTSSISSLYPKASHHDCAFFLIFTEFQSHSGQVGQHSCGFTLFVLITTYLTVRYLFHHREKTIALGPDNMSGVLIDVTKHLCNLKYKVWEKMLDHIDYSEYMLYDFFKLKGRKSRVLQLRLIRQPFYLYPVF